MYVLEAEQHRGWYFGGMEPTTDDPTRYWLTSDKMDAKRFEFASVAIAFGLTLPTPKYASAPMQWQDTQIQVTAVGAGTPVERERRGAVAPLPTHGGTSPLNEKAA